MLSNNLVNYHANKCFEYASLAQLVERWSAKPDVGDSSPSGLCYLAVGRNTDGFSYV